MYNPFSTKKELETLNTAAAADDLETATSAAKTLIGKAIVRSLIVTTAIVGGMAVLAYVLNENDNEEESTEEEPTI